MMLESEDESVNPSIVIEYSKSELIGKTCFEESDLPIVSVSLLPSVRQESANCSALTLIYYIITSEAPIKITARSVC